MRSATRRHLTTGLGAAAAIAALPVLAAPAQAGAPDDPPGWERLASSRWRGLSIGYPPSVLRVVRPPADRPASIVADVDRLVSEGGDFEVALGADDAVVGSAGEYIKIDLDSDRDTHRSVEVTYRARGATWEVASGLIDGKVFYYKAIDFCPPTNCGIPVVSSIKFTYAAGKKGEYDKLLEGMVRTVTPATGRLE
jgi:hypothetical protein